MKLFLLGALVLRVAFGDAVTDWNAIMRVTVNSESPPIQSRFAAITHLAVFEAVNAITRDYQPYLRTLSADEGASPEAAAIAAAHQVLRTYFPASATTLDLERVRSLANLPNTAAKAAGIVVGEAAAAAMIAYRARDGSGTPMAYTPLIGAGYWQPTPTGFAAAGFVHWGKMMPFGIARGDQFSP